MLNLEIPDHIFNQMLRQAKVESPIETCGILAGADGRIQKLYQMTNADKSSVHFMMKPAEQFKAVKDIRAAGLEILGIYHSHPATPARLSAEDIRLALTPDVTYVIISLENENHPVVKGFFIKENNTKEVPVKIV